MVTPLDSYAENRDNLYGLLHGSRERLCRAQMLCKPHWRATIEEAIARIDEVGSTLPQWSRFDQPEYGKGP